MKVGKKIIGMLLASLMAFTILPVSTGAVYAAEIITGVQFEMKAPEPGTTRKDNESVQAAYNSNSPYDVVWSAWYGPGPEFLSDGGGNYTFQANTAYRARIDFKAHTNDGYSFGNLTADDVTISGGKLIEIIEQNEQFFCITVEVETGADPAGPTPEPMGTPITETNFTIDVPKAGTTSDAGISVSVPDGSQYYVDEKYSYWCDEYTFEAGKTYRAVVSLYANEEYYFEDTAAVKINGGTLADLGEDPNPAILPMYMDVYVDVQIAQPEEVPGEAEPPVSPEKTPVTNAKITIAAPAAGTKSKDAANLKPLVSIPSGSGFSLEWFSWYSPAPDYIHPDYGVDEFIFEEGQTYRAAVSIIPDDGFCFTDSTAINISGGTLHDVLFFISDCIEMSVDIPIKAKPAEKSDQTITASNVTKTYGSAAFSLGAKTNGDGKLTYSSSNTGVAAVGSTGKVTIKGAGTAKITIKAAETTKYKAATKTITVTVKKAAQTITTSKSSFTKTFGNAAFALGAKTNGGGKLTYKSNKASVAVVSASGKVTIKGAGNAVITVSAAATANYKAASKTVMIKVGKAANTLKASAKSKTNTVKYSVLKKKDQTITAQNAFKVSGNKGEVTYKKKSGNSKIMIASTGKITIKKGLKRATYIVKADVTAAGNVNYRKGTKTVTLKIRVA